MPPIKKKIDVLRKVQARVSKPVPFCSEGKRITLSSYVRVICPRSTHEGTTGLVCDTREKPPDGKDVKVAFLEQTGKEYTVGLKVIWMSSKSLAVRKRL